MEEITSICQLSDDAHEKIRKLIHSVRRQYYEAVESWVKSPGTLLSFDTLTLPSMRTILTTLLQPYLGSNLFSRGANRFFSQKHHLDFCTICMGDLKPKVLKSEAKENEMKEEDAIKHFIDKLNDYLLCTREEFNLNGEFCRILIAFFYYYALTGYPLKEDYCDLLKQMIQAALDIRKEEEKKVFVLNKKNLMKIFQGCFDREIDCLEKDIFGEKIKPSHFRPDFPQTYETVAKCFLDDFSLPVKQFMDNRESAEPLALSKLHQDAIKDWGPMRILRVMKEPVSWCYPDEILFSIQIYLEFKLKQIQAYPNVKDPDIACYNGSFSYDAGGRKTNTLRHVPIALCRLMLFVLNHERRLRQELSTYTVLENEIYHYYHLPREIREEINQYIGYNFSEPFLRSAFESMYFDDENPNRQNSNLLEEDADDLDETSVCSC